MSEHIARPYELEELAPDATTEIARCASLDAVEYDQQREGVAKELNIRVRTLDAQVQQLQKNESTADPNEGSGLFTEDAPWHTPVEGARLLDGIERLIRRYCVMPEHAPEAVALWCVFAHAHDAFMISPLLALESPERRCGKTTALTVIGEFVPRKLHTANLSAAVLFRVVEHFSPTLLIDEGDSFLRDNEEMRGVLNGGHNRTSAYVLRCVGDDHEPKTFRVWGAKVIALIGELPDTLQDRSVVVPLRRKKPGESVERIRADRLDAFAPLRRQAARWAEDNFNDIADCDPEMPVLDNDRALDNWRSLIAVADIAGGGWPTKARQAAIALSGDMDDDEDTKGVRLLSDCRKLFFHHHNRKWAPTEVVEALCNLDEAPWDEWRGGRPITTRGVAKLLKPYDVQSRRDRDGRYFDPDDFEDAFARYLTPTPGFPSVTSVTSLKYKENSESPSVTQNNPVTLGDSKNINENNAVTLVTLGKGETGVNPPNSDWGDEL